MQVQYLYAQHRPVNEQVSTVNIDLGGGADAHYFHKLARNNPEQTYLVLDPAITHKPWACPPNLHLIRWRSDNDPAAISHLPLKVRSVDTAHLIFLFGELHGRSRPADRHYYMQNAEAERYRYLIHGLKHALKQGGRVHVNEPQHNLLLVEDLFTQEGFTIVQQRTPVEDKHKTEWIKSFYHVVDQTVEGNTESPALPMALVAAL